MGHRLQQMRLAYEIEPDRRTGKSCADQLKEI
jgi:hypothetical protein